MDKKIPAFEAGRILRFLRILRYEKREGRPFEKGLGGKLSDASRFISHYHEKRDFGSNTKLSFQKRFPAGEAGKTEFIQDDRKYKQSGGLLPIYTGLILP
ncbi:MAG: hypothetical protein ACI4J7_04625 [Ruminiclostridium sp.]